MDVAIGTVLDGRYRIAALLGTGGLSNVYRAEQEELSRHVAIKVLHAHDPCPEDRLRFEREAKILAELRHKNIVQIYSVGFTGDGQSYMAMELIEGRTLDDLLTKNKHLDPARAVKIGLQICQALSAAHQAGIVHRDLKPQNIMVLNSPETDTIKILDFGLSRLLPAADQQLQRLTQTGTLIGSIRYMSPEMCSGLRADERSDIYAFGCILYEALAGRPCIDCDNPIGMLHKHKTELPPPINLGTNTAVPRELELIVFKALQKDPVDRFQSMAEFESALNLFAQGRCAELRMAGVRFGSIPRKVSIVPVVCFLAIPIVVFCLALQHKSTRAVIKGQATIQSVIERTRMAEIKRANSLMETAKMKMNAGEIQKSQTLMYHSIQALGRSYPEEVRTKDCAVADLAVLTALNQICGDKNVRYA